MYNSVAHRNLNPSSLVHNINQMCLIPQPSPPTHSLSPFDENYNPNQYHNLPCQQPGAFATFQSAQEYVQGQFDQVHCNPRYRVLTPPSHPAAVTPPPPVPKRPQATVRILEQPTSNAFRFRYECEGRSAGSILGASSTSKCKTYPKIKVEGFVGTGVVVVSCVSKDALYGGYSVHPHNLVGKHCKHGVCSVQIPPETMTVEFANIGIQCVKKKDIEQALRAKEKIRVDPYKKGFDHAAYVDLNAVRLCFQVFLDVPGEPKKYHVVPPVVSEPIFDKKTISALQIVKLCCCRSSVEGGQEIIILCEKVVKDDIQIKFFELANGEEVWQAIVEIDAKNVHHQTALSVKTPAYHNVEVSEPVRVFLQLRRPSDGLTSEPREFMFLPTESGKRKRQRLETSEIIRLEEDLFRLKRQPASRIKTEKSADNGSSSERKQWNIPPNNAAPGNNNGNQSIHQPHIVNEALLDFEININSDDLTNLIKNDPLVDFNILSLSDNSI